MNTRRAILKVLGALPLTGGSAVKAVTAELGMPGVATALAMVGPPANRDDRTSAAERAFGPQIGRYLATLTNRAREERGYKFNLRQDGFDHDIAALKSCSRSFKVAKQHERDIAEVEFYDSLQNKIWG